MPDFADNNLVCRLPEYRLHITDPQAQATDQLRDVVRVSCRAVGIFANRLANAVGDIAVAFEVPCRFLRATGNVLGTCLWRIAVLIATQARFKVPTSCCRRVHPADLSSEKCPRSDATPNSHRP
jgi:hypothetical protein